MDRRKFLSKAGATAAAVGAVAAPAVVTAADKKLKWKMVTSWPRNFPGLGTGAAWLADAITEMSGGRLTVKVYGGGELVPPLEVFDAVSRGTAEMGHSGAYYWKGKSPATQFFTAVPFGLTAIEMHSWLHFGGGMELWREVYDRFNLVPFDAGNTGVQMGGWFNKEINSVADLKGLKMRIPGLGGEVLKRLGGTPVSLPGAELFTSLQSGAIDATEWVGPYNDLAFGLYKAAKHYYYPGWHEPGPVLECMVNKDAWLALPKDLQAIVTAATQAVSNRMLAEYTANNNQALNTLVTKHKVDLRRFPDDVLASLRSTSDEVVAEVAGADPLTQKVYDSFRDFRDNVMAWHDVSERAYLNARGAG
jgi:TRAP-type mannitol/chloroaromatic compound transport system substrate-binding protein